MKKISNRIKNFTSIYRLNIHKCEALEDFASWSKNLILLKGLNFFNIYEVEEVTERVWKLNMFEEVDDVEI